MRRLREERGTVIVFTALILAALMAVAALVVDIGAFFQKQRQLQAAADAATLAGAQDLPDTGTAASTAATYAAANVSGLGSWSPTFPDSNTIDVRLSKSVPGIFSKIVGVTSVTVHAHAQAHMGVPSRMTNVAPVAVKNTAACTSTACFGQTTQINFDESNLSSSKFGLISLFCEGVAPTSCDSSATGASDLENWIRTGYPGWLNVNKWYAAVSGEKIGPVRDTLAQMGSAGTTLLFPVFDAADATAKSFHVIGWAAFVIDPGGVIEWKNDAPSCRPNCKVLQGHFTTYTAEGVDGGSGPYFGVRTISLVQ